MGDISIYIIFISVLTQEALGVRNPLRPDETYMPLSPVQRWCTFPFIAGYDRRVFNITSSFSSQMTNEMSCEGNNIEAEHSSFLDKNNHFNK